MIKIGIIVNHDNIEKCTILDKCLLQPWVKEGWIINLCEPGFKSFHINGEEPIKK